MQLTQFISIRGVVFDMAKVCHDCCKIITISAPKTVVLDFKKRCITEEINLCKHML